MKAEDALVALGALAHRPQFGVQDPAAAEGTDEEKLAVFNKVFRELEGRIKIFCSLPLASLDRVRIKEHVDEIGRSISLLRRIDAPPKGHH